MKDEQETNIKRLSDQILKIIDGEKIKDTLTALTVILGNVLIQDEDFRKAPDECANEFLELLRASIVARGKYEIHEGETKNER